MNADILWHWLSCTANQSIKFWLEKKKHSLRRGTNCRIQFGCVFFSAKLIWIRFLLRWLIGLLKCKNGHVLSLVWIEQYLHMSRRIERPIVAIWGSICDFFHYNLIHAWPDNKKGCFFFKCVSFTSALCPFKSVSWTS